MSTLDYLAGRKVLVEKDSPINGKLTVVYELGWGTYIKAGGLPQSGGLAKKIWEKSLKEVKNDNYKVKSCLVLGFAGGGIAQITRDLWIEAKIYGVDIDPLMVELGRKYLKWEKTGAKVWIQDAEEFIDDIINYKEPNGIKIGNFQFPISRPPSLSSQAASLCLACGQAGISRQADFQFDLVCVDMYVGDSVPAKFSNEQFVRKIKKLVNKDGVAVFNRLYGAHDRGEAAKFETVLGKVFTDIKKVYPAANIMFLCKVS